MNIKIMEKPIGTYAETKKSGSALADQSVRTAAPFLHSCINPDFL